MAENQDLTENVAYQQKLLYSLIRENKPKYLTGELDLTPCLERTEQLFQITSATTEKAPIDFQPDSYLIQIQSKIVKECAKNCKVDSLVFDPSAYTQKIIKNFTPPDGPPPSGIDILRKIGRRSTAFINTVPTFDYLYGSFTADPVETTRKIRKKSVKDKIGDITKPESVRANALSNEDVLTKKSSQLFGLIKNIIETRGCVSFYELVIDADSFTKTVENIFCVSFLVRDGHVEIFDDDEGSPFINTVSPEVKKERRSQPAKQCVLSIGYEDWQDLSKIYKSNPARLRR